MESVKLVDKLLDRMPCKSQVTLAKDLPVLTWDLLPSQDRELRVACDMKNNEFSDQMCIQKKKKLNSKTLI